MTSAELRSSVVSALYDFSASGPGAFTFDPVSKFKVIGADGITHTEIAKAHPVSITITDGVSKPEKRQQVDCADFKHSSAISGSAAGARALASAALSYLKSHGDDDKLYKSYFGSNAIENITSNFLTIVDEGTAPGALSCSDPFNICRDTPSVAYNSGQDIYYCNSFYSQLPLSSLCTGETTVSARNIRGGTTLRQLAGSLIFGMQSPGLSCSDSQQIPVREQIRTDDNYEVSAQTLHCRPRARVLTRGYDLCSVSLPRSITTQCVAKWIMRTSEVRVLWVYEYLVVLSLRLERSLESFMGQNRIFQTAGLTGFPANPRLPTKCTSEFIRKVRLNFCKMKTDERRSCIPKITTPPTWPASRKVKFRYSQRADAGCSQTERSILRCRALLAEGTATKHEHTVQAAPMVDIIVRYSRSLGSALVNYLRSSTSMCLP